MDTAKSVVAFLRAFWLQVRLLLWKRYRESTKSKLDVAKVAVPPILFFLLTLLFYQVFDGRFNPGGLEAYLLPFGFWVYLQRLVVQILYEKGSRLQESMKMMGLYDSSYWLSYFISDGILLGFGLSFVCALISAGGMFNDGSFGEVLGLLFVFCLSMTSFGFFLSAFSDNAQFGTQIAIVIQMALYFVFAVIIVGGEQGDITLRTMQLIFCLFPPTGFQVGCISFLKSYGDNGGIPRSTICGIMFADIFIYSILAWYISQVCPTSVGVRKPFYFPFLRSYWFPNEVSTVQGNWESPFMVELPTKSTDGGIPVEVVNERVLGPPTISVQHLCKTYGSTTVVNNLSFTMYENQIFALLGHNGAGKTTTINILTGLFAPDSVSETSAVVYGHDVRRELQAVRRSLGVCPQHDVLFEKLSVKEHILFFGQLKGQSYAEAEAEADHLISLFHLSRRQSHLGDELSGGQRRKLSVAIAVCGGSKFVVLDEPTAGMDPLARRELWDLLASLRKGRSMLLTTHYMDEADVLGDRIGIMSHGQMKCCGSSQYLKTKLGIGYRLIFDKDYEKLGGASAAASNESREVQRLTQYIRRFIPEVETLEEPGQETVMMFALPFSVLDRFGSFFAALEQEISQFPVKGYNLMITTLEDVFLRVGKDETVTPKLVTEEATKSAANDNTSSSNPVGIGSDRSYTPTLLSQTIGIFNRRLLYAANDWFTLALMLFPVATGILSAALFNEHLLGDDDTTTNLAVIGVCIGGYIGIPGLVGEFIVRERFDKLRNVLNVMGCSYVAYWLGTMLADYLLLVASCASLFLIWGSSGMSNYLSDSDGLNFFVWIILFPLQLLTYSYAHSFLFASPKTCLWSMLALILLQPLIPQVVLLIIVQIIQAMNGSISQTDSAAILWWVSLLISPFGGVYIASLNILGEAGDLTGLPDVGSAIAFMILHIIVFGGVTYYKDLQSSAVVYAQTATDLDETSLIQSLDADVALERERVLASIPEALMTACGGPTNTAVREDEKEKDLEANYLPGSKTMDPLAIQRLRKVFPGKDVSHPAVTAVEDLSFGVGKGEIFGLLGANGAGKTTALSMLTRLLLPNSGNAFIEGDSILTRFEQAATHLGVVTQNNSLWDRLTVENHLYLFARLRGVPEDLVKGVVDGTIDQLELTPHRFKLAMNLSGGMKRKLCVAIALIGDPAVVLLDEPSAGLDPVSRRNLWSVILRTMSNRSVILTTHSMEEAEALCRRIGIMVQGQLRALGSKLQLKNKFGSGFELTVKFVASSMKSGGKVATIEDQIARFTTFLQSLFPSARQLAENGGLITYQIPKEEMKMSIVFQRLNEVKAEYDIEEFTVAQPTLEQVFIHIVKTHTPEEMFSA